VGTPNEVWTWRRGDGKLVLANKLNYPETINKIALSPVGNLLAVASNDKSLWLQLLPSGSVITRLGGQDNVVAEVAFSPDGTLLATRALSGEVNLWKIDWQGFGALGSEFVTTIVGSNWFGNLVFSPDGKTLASGSYYEGVHIWNIADQKYFNLFSADPSQEIIHAVTFSADGSAIYTGGSGGIGVWRTFFDVAEPRYFRRSAAITDPNDLALIAEWPNHVQPIGEAGSHLDLYHADELLTFDLAVPGSLPEQVRFVEAQVLENGGGLLHYVVGSPMEVRGDLYILEYPPGSSATLLPVSEDTTVEDIRLGSIFAEYVQGNWRSGDLPTTGGTNEAQWVWDDSLPVQRLHLRIDQVFVALFYQERVSDRQPDSGGSLETSYQVGEWYPDTTLYKEDLIQIALGIDSLPPYIPGETNLIAYQIQEGDTCIGIASYFDTSVEALVELNDLPNDCSLIRTGDVLKVPVFRERLDFEGYDLDCDAQDERLQVIPALGTPGQSLVSAIYLQDASVMGLYRDTWQMTAPGEEVDNFSYPVILDLGECQSFVAVRGVGGEKPGLRIYHWENGQMALVYGHGTSLLGSDADKDTVKVMEELGDPASGTCQAWEVTYQWDGVQFNELERKSSFCGSSPNP
jgi:LysM repeat protein